VLFGHDPTPKPKHKAAQWAWADAHHYSIGKFGKKGWEGVMFAQTKNNQIKSENYQGFDRLMEVLGDATLKGYVDNY
jgi:hypothetical protein